MMNYKKMTINDIIAWCKANNQVEWLKAEVNKKTSQKVYPKKTIINADGKKVKRADKDQPYTLVEKDITFVQIKKEFAEKFMPEILPVAKEKKPTMKDMIAAL
jgi:tRNA/tmRNA/rRNA uracil-C5-methylase (TrmA/RlmC/RlmD family)